MIRIAVTFALMAPAAFAGEIWVTNEKDDTISVISTETLEVIQTYETGERPRGIMTRSKSYCSPTTAISISPMRTTRSPLSSIPRPAR